MLGEEGIRLKFIQRDEPQSCSFILITVPLRWIQNLYRDLDCCGKLLSVKSLDLSITIYFSSYTNTNDKQNKHDKQIIDMLT